MTRALEVTALHRLLVPIQAEAMAPILATSHLGKAQMATLRLINPLHHQEAIFLHSIIKAILALQRIRRMISGDTMQSKDILRLILTTLTGKMDTITPVLHRPPATLLMALMGVWPTDRLLKDSLKRRLAREPA